MPRVVLFIFFFSLLLLATTNAQNEKTFFHSLSVNEGLSHSSVYALLQDRNGFIWAGTADGLNRYNGKEIKIYRPAEALQNPDAAYIRDMLVEDTLGNIWFANNTGIYCHDAQTDKIVRKRFFRNESVSIYNLTSAGDLWIHMVSTGILNYNVYTNKTTFYPYPFSFPNGWIQYFVNTTDKQGNCWFVLHDDNVLYYFNTENKKYHAIPMKTAFNNVCYNNGELWLMNEKSIQAFNPKTLQRSAEIQTINAPFFKSSLITDRQGNSWLSTYGSGLYRLDKKYKIAQHYKHNNHIPASIPSDLITELLIDRNNNLWIGTDGGGVARINLKPDAFEKFPKDERDYTQLTDFFIKTLFEDKDRMIWFATYCSGLNILNPFTDDVHHVGFASLSSQPLLIHALYNDGENIWIGHSGGLGYFNKKYKTFHPVTLNKSKEATAVFKIIKDETGCLIMATSNGPKIVTKKGSRWEENTAVQSRKLRCVDLIPAGNNEYWMVMPYNGLYLVQYNNAVFATKDSFLFTQNIRSIHRDELDTTILWLASQKGLVRFSSISHQYQILNTENGLANAHIYGVLEDENHNLWMSTNGGISCYDRKTKKFQNYNYKSGLQSNEFNSSAFYKGTSGNLYFGGVKGFNWFTAASVGFDTSTPQVAINYLKVNDSLLAPPTYQDNATISLPYYLNALNFSIAVLDFSHPEASLVRYKLEGWDKKWFTATPGEIRYSNLLPGKYMLRFSGIGNNKKHSKEYNLTIYIIAPYWQQFWFRLLIAAIFIACGFAIVYIWYKQKLKKAFQEIEHQKKLAAERNRISEDLHDEIGSAITQISILSQQTSVQQKEHHALMQDVNIIAATAKKVAQSMSEIVWTLHSQNDMLESMLAYLREQSREFLQSLHIKYHIDFPDEVPPVKLSGEQRRNILLVTKEALNNAVKYAQAQQITLSCNIENDKIIFKVTDDGIGFIATQAHDQGNGLKNMQRRMSVINGFIAWHQPGKGTCVIYSIPI